MMKKVVIIGNGGHAKVILDIINRKKDLILYAILDDSIIDKFEKDDIIYDSLSKLKEYLHAKLIIGIGNNKVREKIVKKFNLDNHNFLTIIDESAIISQSAKIDVGTVVMPNAIINSNAIIGKHSIINSGAIVEHDNKLGDYTHISPGATLSGTVTVGNFTHIGSGSVVIPNIQIGENCIIGAGSVIIKDIESNVTAVGNPARIIKRSE
ncbi:acetyltransferase [Macrococcus armenti]|uniref:acetyltransferase n=1 Tax=Macrococcus armenti TaxID=2875764 RepID=UPI002407C0D2|nr:acetyltransferase [Macrococcus armenti]